MLLEAFSSCLHQICITLTGLKTKLEDALVIEDSIQLLHCAHSQDEAVFNNSQCTKTCTQVLLKMA